MAIPALSSVRTTPRSMTANHFRAVFLRTTLALAPVIGGILPWAAITAFTAIPATAKADNGAMWILGGGLLGRAVQDRNIAEAERLAGLERQCPTIKATEPTLMALSKDCLAEGEKLAASQTETGRRKNNLDLMIAGIFAAMGTIFFGYVIVDLGKGMAEALRSFITGSKNNDIA